MTPEQNALRITVEPNLWIINTEKEFDYKEEIKKIISTLHFNCS